MSSRGKISKFLRRHKIAVIGIALGVAVLQLTQSMSGSGDFTFQQGTSAVGESRNSVISLEDPRDSELILPKNYKATSSVPLLINLHGYSGDGPSQSAYTYLQQATFNSGVAYIAPNGSEDNFGNNYWNATTACCDFNLSKVDDIAFINSLIDRATKAANIDPKRIYLFGHSNGHLMTYAFLCSGTKRIAAVAGIAGAMDPDPKRCSSSPSHLLHIHGQKDGTILYDGGALLGNQYTSVAETLNQWKAINQCKDGESTLIDGLASIPGEDIDRTEFNCAKGSLELWSIPNGSHAPKLDIDFANKVLTWLLQY